MGNRLEQGWLGMPSLVRYWRPRSNGYRNHWAEKNGFIVFTHDLDFGTALALTHATGPSVLQIRGQKVLPEQASSVVVAALQQYEAELEAGALLVVEESKNRVRILPF